MRKSFGVLIFMIFIIVSAIAEGEIEIGQPAPNFTLEDIDGNKVSLSDFSGKVVLLNFWAMSCYPCRAEMPSMEALYQKFKKDGLMVVAVNFADGKKVLKDFIKETKYTFLILDDIDRKARALYPSYGIPYTIVIDRNGIVRYTQLGSVDWMHKKRLSLFKKLLKE